MKRQILCPLLGARLLLVAASLCAVARVHAQNDLRSTWECLPEETVFAVRVPDGAALAEALVENTKLGTVLFHEDRLEKLRELAAQPTGPDGEDLATALEEVGLTPDDLPQFLAGESGYAVLVELPADGSPLAVGLGWLGPGVDLAERTYQAIGRAIELHEDDEHPPRRVDLELADQAVMQITVPVMTYEYGEFELPDNYDSLSEEEQSRAWDEAYDKYEENVVETVNFQSLLVAVLEDRMLVAHTFDESPEDRLEATEERLERIFARLLAAHQDEPGGFLPRILATRGIGPVLDLQGTPVMELLADPARLIQLARAQEEFQADEEREKVMSILGADSLGPFALRMALDGQRLHSRMFLSAPEPRSGLVRLLDQQARSPEVPAWVPATAISYSHFSFDLGRAYQIVKEEVTRQFPEQANQWFTMVDMQTQNFAQASLAQILDALGARIMSVSFEPEMIAQDLGDGVGVEVSQDRMAIIWEVKDDDVWNRLLKAIGTFAAFAPGLQATDEQGFNGWRMENEQMEGGLVSGKGYLVLAIGRGVLETTLASLNNPPSGRAAFRESELFARASELMELRPAVAFEVADGNRYALALHEMFRSMLEQMEAYSEAYGEDFEDGEDVEMTDAAGYKLFRSLMPSEEEVDGIFGPVVSDLQVNEDGVLIRAVNILPPPE